MSIVLRKFQESDIPYKVKWINDEENNKFLHYDLPLREDKTLEWFRSVQNRTDRIDYTVLYNDEPAGLIGLINIDHKNKKAEYYICLGGKRFKGKGIAYIASDILIRDSFERFGLNKIYLYTEIDNVQAQSLFEKIGFVKEGLLKSDLLYYDRVIDRYVYGLNVPSFVNGSLKRIKSNNLITTPIYELNQRINSNILYIKRDDLIPFSFGGNKARKAFLFFEDIKKENADCVVTYGSSSSNHCRVISNIAAAKELPCYIISPTEDNSPTYNSMMIELFGAKVIQCPVSEVNVTIDKLISELKTQGHNPYFIQGGGHGNIGTQAYVNAYQEILDYEKSKEVYFDYIFFAAGTGTTQAGLICAKVMNNDDRNIVGISIARKKPYGGQVVLDSVNSYLKSVGRDSISLKHITFVDDYVVDGYGTYNKDILRTTKEVLIRDGIPMDPTYTGKAYWGMKEYIMKNKIINKNILFIHTGGAPLFFDGLGDLMNVR
ncbi:MAG: pyridoxal-phosphate dependent enzyme [Syntrophomonadaceae bacterium]|nr:pyridoxal-phosphate dependent enzyme [Syntrophomonadaceae bacterium]